MLKKVALFNKDHRIISFLSAFFEKDDSQKVFVDLGHRYIKAIYLKENRIEKFLIEKNRGIAAHIVSDWLRKEGFSPKKVKLSLKGSDTLIRYVAFPKVDKKNLKEVFSYEISKYIPFKKEEVYFDVFVLDENFSSEEFLLLVAVARRTLIDKLIGEFEQEKINVEEITLNNISLLNLYTNISDRETNAATVDIGAISTLLNLFKKGIPVLSREIKTSANEFINRLVKLKDIKEEEAEQIILTIDEARDTTEVQEIIEIIEEVGLELAEEIKDSLDYFEVNWGERIQKVLLTGGLSRIKGFDKIIENSLGVEINLWNPFAYVSGYNIVSENVKNYKEFIAPVLGSSL